MMAHPTPKFFNVLFYFTNGLNQNNYDQQLHRQEQEILQQNENRIRQREHEVAAELLSKHLKLQQNGTLLQQLHQFSQLQNATATTFTVLPPQMPIQASRSLQF